MKKLQWLMLGSHLPPDGAGGGIVRYTAELATALARRDDVVVSMLVMKPSAAAAGRLVGPAGRVFTMPDTPTAAVTLAERFLPLPVLRRGFDVVHGVKHVLPKHSPATRVLTVHDMLLLDRPADFGRAKRLFLPPVYRNSIRDADLLVCVSAATRDRLRAYEPDVADVAVVPLATSAALRNSVPEPLPRLAGRTFALVVGDASPRKNLGVLLQAWETVASRRTGALLAIAGPPNWARTENDERFERLVASGDLIALGHIDDSELRWAYQNAAVVLCPSLAEGFGLPAAEALDFGAPLVVSDDAALMEVAAGRAFRVVPATSIAGWSSAVVDAFEASTRNEQAAVEIRSWDQVADETVAAVRGLHG